MPRACSTGQESGYEYRINRRRIWAENRDVKHVGQLRHDDGCLYNELLKRKEYLNL